MRSERDEARDLAERVLDRPYADPDDDLAVLARQFKRAIEAVEAANDRAARLTALANDVAGAMQDPAYDSDPRLLIRSLEHTARWALGAKP